MISEYYNLLTSATSMEEAKKIASCLVESHLVAGLQVIDGAPCMYWWDNRVVEKIYFNITGFTIGENKEKIVEQVRALHVDKVPTIIFTKIDGAYSEFMDWISNNTKTV